MGAVYIYLYVCVCVPNYNKLYVLVAKNQLHESNNNMCRQCRRGHMKGLRFIASSPSGKEKLGAMVRDSGPETPTWNQKGRFDSE